LPRPRNLINKPATSRETTSREVFYYRRQSPFAAIRHYVPESAFLRQLTNPLFAY
jgi:hypothetical protein